MGDFDDLNDRFVAWAEQVCNTRVHAETNQVPMEAFLAAGPPRAAHPSLVAEAFRWSVMRVVSKTAVVAMASNRYQVNPSLVGRRVELRFDPEDLSSLDVYLEGRPAGTAVPFVMGHHVHPGVPQALPPAPEPTGVDYLGLVLGAHEQATAGPISYRDVPLFDPDTGEVTDHHQDLGDNQAGGTVGQP